jgi:type 1 glutamine amidotransferase
MSAPSTPVLLVIAGPAGSGKSTLCDRLVAEIPEFERVVTTTTRAPRPGEINGVHYHFLTPEQFDALNAFVQNGRGFLPIHCASACFGHERRFVSLVGGRFKSHKSGVFKPVIIAPQHPIFEGVTAYETWDETYVHCDINAESRELLMERREESHVEPWTWTRTEGKGRVFYTASGHDERTWKDPQFQRMLRNAIVWSVGDERKGAWEKARAARP